MRQPVVLSGKDIEFLKRYFLVLEKGMKDSLEEMKIAMTIGELGVKLFEMKGSPDEMSDQIDKKLAELKVTIAAAELDTAKFGDILDRIYQERVDQEIPEPFQRE